LNQIGPKNMTPIRPDPVSVVLTGVTERIAEDASVEKRGVGVLIKAREPVVLRKVVISADA
jgi:hypothetical protein